MKFGVEIECWAPMPIDCLASALRQEEGFSEIKLFKSRRDWALVEDHSLTEDYSPAGFFGVELVSPVLNTKSTKDLGSVVKLCEALQRLGCVVDGRCGLHVHLDARGMTLGRAKRIFQRYTAAEPFIDALVSGNRKTNRFALGGKGILKDVLSSTDFDDLDNRLHERYRKVNLCALSDHGTIEFRQHEGTINGFTILDWVGFLCGFVQSTKTPREAVEATKKGSLRYRLFSAVHDRKPSSVTVDELSAELGIPASTITWHLRRLQSQGLVRKLSPNVYASTRKDKEEAAEELTESQPLSIWEGVAPEVRSRLLDRSASLSSGSRTVLEKLIEAKA